MIKSWQQMGGFATSKAASSERAKVRIWGDDDRNSLHG